MKTLTDISISIRSDWQDRLKEQENEGGYEFLDFEDECLPIMNKRLREGIISFIKEKYNPDKTTIEIKDLLEMFNLSGKDLIKDADHAEGEQ